MPIQVSVSSSAVRFVNRALAQVSREMENKARAEILAIGGLVERDAEAFALTRIRNMPRSPGWADMRVGANQELVYVVPARRGVRKGKRKRPNLAPLMLRQAMRPAKTKNEPEIVARFEKLTAEIVASFNQ